MGISLASQSIYKVRFTYLSNVTTGIITMAMMINTASTAMIAPTTAATGEPVYRGWDSDTVIDQSYLCSHLTELMVHVELW